MLHLVMLRRDGSQWNRSLPMEEQSRWQEHAEFMDQLVADGVVLLGGPLADDHRVALVMSAASSAGVLAALREDPWYGTHLSVESVEPWTIRLDGLRIADAECCAVTELRRYALKPGARDVLVELFERHFLEGHQAVGMHVIGTFVDLDDADTFIWLRGFRDMDQRRRALQAFYSGDIWQRHRAAANATMVDSDNVLLLAPVSAKVRPGHPAAPAGVLPVADVTYTIDVHRVDRELVADAAAGRHWVDRHLAGARTAPLGVLVTIDAENTFPALPVRTDLSGYVVVTRHISESQARGHADAVAGPDVATHVCLPTPRSPLR